MARELCEEEDKSNEMVTTAGAGFFYSDNSNLQSHFSNQMIPNGFGSTPVEIFNLTTGIENMMGFSKSHHHHHHHQHEPDHHRHQDEASSSSLKAVVTESTNPFYHKMAEFTTASDAWPPPPPQENRFELVDDSSLRCVFPCEGNERPSQGLSLSLSSSNPSSIGLQSFELRQQTNHQHQILQQQDEEEEGGGGEDGFLGKLSANLHQQTTTATAQFFQLRNSRFLVPAQELLYEFCSLGILNKNQNDSSNSSPKQQKKKMIMGSNSYNNNNSTGSSSRKESLQSLDFLELQKRKTRLFSMLEELERRYRHYCEQMKAVVSSFEEVAGRRAATVYSALASKAMSRHFRCLKDGIVSQIQATKIAMGEKDPVAPGTTRGETPRLRVIDQAIRQHRAFQQISLMESHPWRPQRGLPERSVSVLRAWLFEHFLHPYPSDVDKHILARQTGLSRSQVSNWFINARVRLWKPMVEEMYVEETKEGEEDYNNYNNNVTSSDGLPDLDDINVRMNQNRRLQTRIEDQKPTPDQLLRIDSECLSSLITNSEKNDLRSTKTMQNNHHHVHNQGFERVATETFGTVELDFSSYNHHSNGGVSYPNNSASVVNNSQRFGVAGGVSLTLGLQQHAGGNGVSIAFSPGSQSSLFYTRDQMEECQPVSYSLLEGEPQNLPYRNLMGAQLLHDLAG